MLTSINLNSIPFLSSTDATRASMASKQIQQTLTGPNQEIPYVIGSEYYHLRNTSSMGLMIAPDDGKVILRRDDLLVVFYTNLNKLEDIYVPPIKKTHSDYATTLKYCIDENAHFSKGDILVSYDCFINGIPTYGYNVFTAFLPFFGYNHEDSIVISEDFAERATHTYLDKIFIPIFDYTILSPFYKDVDNSYIYFPAIGQQIKDDIVCCIIIPKGTEDVVMNSSFMKNNVQNMFKSMNLSSLLSLNNIDNTKFSVNKIKSKIKNGTIVGMKIHRFKKRNEIDMIDKNLQDVLHKLYINIYGKHITDVYQQLNLKFGTNNPKNSIQRYTDYILKKYYLCRENYKRGKLSLHDACYLIEFEICKNEKVHYGDKLCNRYSNKGVVSLVIPNELRPIASASNKFVDLIFNPFGVFSRMNLGQIIEILVSKPVMYCDEIIKNNPKETKNVITWLNESVLKHIDKEYYERIKNEIITNLDDENFKNSFIENVKRSNLFVEAPCFAKINIKKLIHEEITYNETIVIPKKLVYYIKDKLKVDLPVINNDLEIPNIFCGPMYIQKIAKIAAKIINARDLGIVKSITKQPTKGRAKSGGSRLGQMEIEAIIANGTEKAIKELLSVKSDWSDGKNDLIKQLIVNGQYNLPENRTIHSRTKDVVDTHIQFLKE